jgi:rhodanese-related sulfurtransferase
MVVEKSPVTGLGVVSVWDRLKADSTAQLIDVRTRAEWSFVGVPDLAALGKGPLLIEWQSFPENRPDPNFATALDAELSARGLGKSTNLYFICRSGARSMSAARAMAAMGYSHCHNVNEGFEGPINPDPAHPHRGTVSGWKFAKLPWSQG